MTDPLWSDWQRVLVQTTLPHEYAELVQTKRIENFESVIAGEGRDFQGDFWFNDSDVHKWIEASAYALAATAHHPELRDSSRQLRNQVDQAVDLLARAQADDGYLNTFFQLRHPDLKWRNLNTMHEMYVGGHLIEAGVAMFECLGDRRLLNVSIKFADHVASIFGPGRRLGYCGHEEIELALIRLSRATGNQSYRELAKWMIEARGQRPSPFEAEFEDVEAMKLSPWAARMLCRDGEYRGEYCQDHAPIREHESVVGHAVRAMYLYIAAAEFADDPELLRALERAWTNLTQRRMYITGGIGPSAANEGFTSDFDLPNLTAYAETCAAVGLVMWGHSLLSVTADGDYADVMERALYNGALSGISLSGDRFFYVNPLESRGQDARTPWFSCACCPPNIARLIGNVATYAISESEDALYVHLPIGLDVESRFGSIRITRDSAYDGQAVIEILSVREPEFGIAIRIPEWADNLTSDLPGAQEEAECERGYAIFRRAWRAGDRLSIEIESEPKWIEANPLVRDNLGRAALTYGPFVYCAEEIDNGFAPQTFTADIAEEAVVVQEEPYPTLQIEGIRDIADPEGPLYAEAGETGSEAASLRLIPYFAWNNRGAGNMQVWLRRI